MALSNLSLSSTFFEHIIRTNQCVKVINDIENQTHPLANIVLEAAATASNVANLAVNVVLTNNTILSAISNGVNSIITSMYSNVYSDSNTAVSKANVAYNQSNIAYNISNSAYDAANSFISNSANIISNVILSNTNTYNIIINVASQHIDAYLANVSINVIYGATNAAFGHSNAAFLRANTANLTANMAYANALFANTTAIAAFAAANAAGSSETVILAYDKSNSAAQTANAAFAVANNAGANTIVLSAYATANAAYNVANIGVANADAAGILGATAHNLAALAFTAANNASMNVLNELSSSDTFYPTMVKIPSGTTNQMNVSSTKLYFKPSTGELTSYSFNSLSDENVKDNIQRINNAIDLIEKLNGVSFNWKESGTKSSGVVAQNLINVVPYLVYHTDGQPLTVNYDGLSALFIEAIKELNQEINKIKQHLGI